MTATTRDVHSLIRRIRTCFNQLKSLGDALHRDLGITAAMRGVIEALEEGGEQTVPQIARSKRVTRQHIQAIVNELSRAELVLTRPNPDDRRSPLVALTRSGRSAYRRMRQREQAVLDELTRALSTCDLDKTLSTMDALHGYLDGRLQQESDA